MYYNYYQNLKNGGIFVNNCLFIKRLSFLLTLVILTNFLFVSYSEAKQNVDYDYIQKVLTEVDSIDKSLNSMHLSFEDILKSKPTNEKMNKAWANAYLTSIGEEGIILTTTPSQITLSPINKAPQTVKQTTESQIYAERLCYARKIAEINKKRDSNAKDLDSESVYMYISHYLDIPGGPLPLDMPVDYHSNNSLMSAWITNADRNVYERFLSFEMREKAKKAMGDFETYAQIAHKEQTLEALQQYDNNIKGLHEAMKGYNELYVALADLGIGFPRSLRESNAAKTKGLWAYITNKLQREEGRLPDHKILREVVEAEQNITSTEQANRGKGIAHITQLAREDEHSGLAIWSYKGGYIMKKEKSSATRRGSAIKYSESIQGTIIYWSIPIAGGEL